MHRNTARGQRAVELPECTATLSVGSGKQISCKSAPQYVRAMGGGTPQMHRHTACAQVEVVLLQ